MPYSEWIQKIVVFYQSTTLNNPQMDLQYVASFSDEML